MYGVNEKMKTYLRLTNNRNPMIDEHLDIFDGDVENDKKYWKMMGYNVRYFEVKEINDK